MAFHWLERPVFVTSEGGQLHVLEMSRADTRSAYA